MASASENEHQQLAGEVDVAKGVPSAADVRPTAESPAPEIEPVKAGIRTITLQTWKSVIGLIEKWIRPRINTFGWDKEMRRGCWNPHWIEFFGLFLIVKTGRIVAENTQYSSRQISPVLDLKAIWRCNRPLTRRAGNPVRISRNGETPMKKSRKRHCLSQTPV